MAGAAMRRQPAAPYKLLLLCLILVWARRSQAAFSSMTELSGSQRCQDKFSGCQHTGEQGVSTLRVDSAPLDGRLLGPYGAGNPRGVTVL